MKKYTALLLLFLLCVTLASGAGYRKFSIQGGALIPTAAEVDTLDAFWGGGVSYQMDNFKVGMDLFAGRGKITYTYVDQYWNGSTWVVTTETEEVEFDDFLLGLTADYLFYMNPNIEDGGFYWGGGLGIFSESVKMDGFDEESTGSSFSLQAVSGFDYKGGGIFCKYIHFLSSDNVTGNIYVGAQFTF